VQEANGGKSSTREFLSFVPTACFEAATMKVADIFLNLWKKEKKHMVTLSKLASLS
jgi:hypothetical protein